MTRKALIVILLVSAVFVNMYGQNDNYTAGTRAAGMGGTSVMLSDLWSNYHNQAALGFLQHTEVGVHHENRYLTQELSLSAIAAVIPTNSGNFGANISYFGYSQYHESKIGLAYSKAFGDFIAAGIQFDYLYTFLAEEYGNVGKVVFEAGIFTEPINNLTLGFHVFNPTQTKIERLNNEPITTAFRAGIGYSFDGIAFIGIELEEQLDYESNFRVGIEYQLIENIFFRAGVNTYPREYALGLGYWYRNLKADIAFSNHQPLGITPHFSFSYAFK